MSLSEFPQSGAVFCSNSLSPNCPASKPSPGLAWPALKRGNRLGVVVQVCSPHIQEAEAGGSRFHGQCRLCSESDVWMM